MTRSEKRACRVCSSKQDAGRRMGGATWRCCREVCRAAAKTMADGCTHPNTKPKSPTHAAPSCGGPARNISPQHTAIRLVGGSHG